MAINSYGTLKNAILDYINRPDLVPEVADFIRLAECTLNGIIRHRLMITSALVSIVATSDRGEIPSDLIDAYYVVSNTDRTKTLTRQTPEQLSSNMRLRQATPGVPLYYLLQGGFMVVSPIPSTTQSILLNYYQEIPQLSATRGTNWLLEHFPNLYLYTSLIHAATFMADDQRAELFKNDTVQMVQSLVANNQTTTLENQPYNKMAG